MRSANGQDAPAVSTLLAGVDIVIFATAGWNGNSVNCHHITQGLARTNRVMFIESTGLRRLHPRDVGKITERLSHFVQSPRTGPKGPLVISPMVPPTRHFRGLRAAITKRLLQQQIRSALRRHGFVRPVLLSFHPFGSWLQDVTHWRAIAYYCVDDYAAIPGACVECVTTAEQALLDRANVVFSTSRTLFTTKRPISSTKVHWVPNNAIDTELFDGHKVQSPVQLEQLPRPIVGFVGNLTNYKVDLELVQRVAQSNRGISFVLVGPVGVGEPSTANRIGSLRALPNVHLIGPRPHTEMPAWIGAFDVCWIPFRINAATENDLPMKFFEYLASGRPVLSTDLPALREYAGAYWKASNADETSAAIRDALNSAQDSTRVDDWIRLGRSYTWTSRIDDMKSIVHRALDSGA